MKFTYLFILCLALSVCFFATPSTARIPISVKFFVITMFDIPGIGGETLRWIQRENLTEQIAVPGISPRFPYVHCKPAPLYAPFTSDMCAITTDETFANAGPSIMATILSGLFNFEKTYFLVAGIAGVDPADGTLGSAAWARYVINYGTSHEIDAREMPADWPYGYTGFGPVPPGVYPPRSNWIGVEVYQLNEAVLQRALAVTQNVVLSDNSAAQTYRALYLTSPAIDPPSVIQCDSVAIDTYWHGFYLSKRANDWTSLLTNGTGNYCMTNEEDSAIMTALKRGDNMGLLDFNRVAVLRTASNFDQPHPGQTAWESLNAYSGGFFPSCENAYRVGAAWAHEVIHHWHQYEYGVPQ
jgi:purine nucleoside permease